MKKGENPLRIKENRQVRIQVMGACLAVWVVVNCISFHPVWVAPRYPQLEIEQMFKGGDWTQDGYQTLFLQTGLGPSALDVLAQREDWAWVCAAQEAVFGCYALTCLPVIEGLTGEDRLVDEQGDCVLAPAFVDVRPGDILVTLSPHSVGWHHGHAGLVVEGDMVLESFSLGMDSGLATVESWRRYSQYALLRVKDGTQDQCNRAVAVGMDLLFQAPYDLLAGLVGEKYTAQQEPGLGSQCAYLPWYAWAAVGVDLDGDGGRLVTPTDLLQSAELEIVQMFGFPLEQYCSGSVQKVA